MATRWKGPGTTEMPDVTPRERHDARQLSNKPAAIRARMRRNRTKLNVDYDAFVAAVSHRYKPLDEWDYEELERGKPRNADGGWHGRRPTWITPLVQAEIARRLKAGTMEQIQSAAGSAVKVLMAFLEDEEEPHLRFRAAQLLLEYVIGKPDQKLTVDGDIRLQAVLADALVLEDGKDAHPVVDGQFMVTEED